MRTLLRKITIGISCLSLSLGAFSAQAETYPQGPVKIVISNGPGGPIDMMTRLIADKLSKKWDQAVIIENRPGASGIISTSALTRAKPDGLTLGMVVASSVTVVPFATKSLPFDVKKDLQPISLVARTPFVFLVAADSPIKSWQDFIDLAKEKEMDLGSYSIGTAFHLTWEQIAKREDVKVLYIPSPQAGKTQGDLLGGLLDISLDSPSSAMGLINSDQVRALAVTSKERFTSLPDVPTLDESGIEGYASEPWIGLMAPAGLDEKTAAFIHQSLIEVLEDEDLKQKMVNIGMVTIGADAAALAKAIENDQAEMQPLVKELGIKLN